MFLFFLFNLSSRFKNKGCKFTLHRALYVHALLITKCNPTSPQFSIIKKASPQFPDTQLTEVLTNSLSKGYYNFLACCDFGDPTHNSLDSIHPYFELHGSPDHPRAMNASQSSHTCSYTRDNAADFSQQLEERKILVFIVRRYQCKELNKFTLTTTKLETTQPPFFKNNNRNQTPHALAMSTHSVGIPEVSLQCIS